MATENSWALYERVSRACYAGRLDQLMEYVERGFNVNYSEMFEMTSKSILGIACTRKDIEMVKYLISVGATINPEGYRLEWPLWDACRGGSLEVVEYLIAHGAVVNTPSDLNYCPLKVALYGRDAFEIVRCLIKHGVNIHFKNLDKRTILHGILSTANRDAVQLLIQHGADVNAKDRYSYTPLVCASGNSLFWLIKLLVENGARLNDEYDNGCFVLDSAITYPVVENALRNARYLISKGATKSFCRLPRMMVRHAQSYAMLCDKVQDTRVVQFIHGF